MEKSKKPLLANAIKELSSNFILTIIEKKKKNAFDLHSKTQP